MDLAQSLTEGRFRVAAARQWTLATLVEEHRRRVSIRRRETATSRLVLSRVEPAQPVSNCVESEKMAGPMKAPPLWED